MALGLLAALFAACFSLFMVNEYRSEARILPADTKSPGSLGQLASAAAAFGVGMPGGDSGDANFPDILGSRSVKEDLLNTEFTFRIRSWAFGGEQTRRQTLYSYLEAKNMDRALGMMGRVIGVGRDLKTKIITVSAETQSPELSRQIVLEMTKDLGAFVMEKGRTKGGEKARFATDRLQEARGELAQAQEDFKRFLEVNRNYLTSADPTIRLHGASLEAEYKLRQQLVMTLAVNREQAMMEEKNDIPIVNVLDPANLPIEKSRPSRSLIVLATFLAVSLAALAWLNRQWLRTHILDSGTDGDDPVIPDKEFV